MRWVAIPNQENGFIGIMHVPFDKITYLISCNGFFKNHEPKFSALTDSAHHIQSESGTRRLNNREFSNRSPSCAGMKVGTNFTFIVKIDICDKFLRQYIGERPCAFSQKRSRSALPSGNERLRCGSTLRPTRCNGIKVPHTFPGKSIVP
jgi:hypothetical protein